MKINIETFNNWALKDRDLKMQEGHVAPVDFMLDLVSKKTDIFNRNFFNSIIF